ncbi:MAG TPA: hypothetical protein VNZ22_17700 [Bacillota bacterium]|nr:hypothetical protein [Bacillota bacterium]
MKRLQTEIANKAATLETLAQRVVSQPELLQEVFEGLGAPKARIKYGCLKLLRILSETKPALLYPEIGKLFDLLESENNILKWGAIIIVGNLAAVDSESRIDGVLERYLQPISGPVLITAANVIGGAGRIAQAKPYLADQIARALLQVEAASYQTAECRNVALGHAVGSLDLIFEHLKQPQPVVEFVKRQLNNDRDAVKRKATRFLKRHAQPAKTAGARATSSTEVTRRDQRK